MINPCCKTCHWWDLDHAKDGAGRVRRQKMAACKIPKSKILLPISMEYGPKRWTRADEGAECVFWTTEL